MKAVRPQGRAGGGHQRAGNIHAPKAVPTLGLGEKHYLAWGILRLALGVVQMAFAATAILCLIIVGLFIVGYPTADGRWKAPLASNNNGLVGVSVM